MDFWIGAIGFVITIATFGLGWRKLAKVESAAQAAKVAVETVKLRVSRYDASVDASEALHSYREITRHLEPPEWRTIVQAMSSVRRSAIRIDKPLSDIDALTAEELRRAARQLDKHIRVIERAVSSNLPFPEDYAVRASVRVGEEALEKARRLIEDDLS